MNTRKHVAEMYGIDPERVNDQCARSLMDGEAGDDAGQDLPITIEVPGKPPSLNDYYSGQHWSERKRTRDQWHTTVAAIASDLDPVDEYPVAVDVTVGFGHGRQRYDTDNLIPAAKLVTDGLVACGVLKDDGPNQITHVALRAERIDHDGYLTRYTIRRDDEATH